MSLPSSNKTPQNVTLVHWSETYLKLSFPSGLSRLGCMFSTGGKRRSNFRNIVRFLIDEGKCPGLESKEFVVPVFTVQGHCIYSSSLRILKFIGAYVDKLIL
jgi:hypothetical protein